VNAYHASYHLACKKFALDQIELGSDLSPRRPLYQAKVYPADARDLPRSRLRRIQNLGSPSCRPSIFSPR